jgi:DNA processing protein
VRDPVFALDPRDPRAWVRARLRAWLALQRRFALRPQVVRSVLEQAPDPLAVLRALAPGGPQQACADPELDAALERLGRAGAVAVPFGSAAYPEALAVLADAAPLLWVRGAPRALAPPLVAVVGARVATAYGLRQARQLARDLAAAGVGVVSGLARGIDAAAHRGALEAGGSTVAVLGCGADRVYPAAHRRLADSIAACGAVVSELPPGAPPLPHHFPLRNRLISGLASAVVVVEARLRSGSLVTAAHAADQGREVLAVPGPVDAPTSDGPNRLLRDGAAPALDARDVLHAIGIEPPEPSESSPARRAELEAGALAIERALQREPSTRDELARRLGTTPQALARDLLTLELDGRIVEQRDGRLRVLG